MYQTILVPLDGSERAEKVIPYVEHLAQYEQAKVVFAEAIEPATRSAVVNPEQEEVTFKPQNISKVKEYLESWRDKFQSQGFTAEILLLRGVAVDAILHAADIVKADLVAMTSQGYTGLSKMFYGSVASGVFNRLQRPLLIVRSGSEMAEVHNRNILVPLDGSKRSEKAIPHAKGIAQLYGAQLLLVRVVRTSQQATVAVDVNQDFREPQVSEPLFNKVGRHQEVERLQKAKDYLLNWKSTLQERGFSVDVSLLYGRPIDSIARIAKNKDVDLIAMTSHGQSGLERIFYGSVASGLMHRLSCPFLLVRASDLQREPVKNFV
ncbi:universal stress protein [Geitlerinema sp. PCC 9228]|uniref:universal stress protein n=1 Tax=Geitlerinema sp. PCC 9228 TaxID=111611 RepID=UPI0008F9A40E|nr:universal stress protein [Geitlerinema sp. PCC 9228]